MYENHSSQESASDGDSSAFSFGVIDISIHVRERYQRGAAGDWCYPNEEHLAPEGHSIVLDFKHLYYRNRIVE
ncbi:hypothetical protein SCALIN_C04_0276 [Candidatus Scalindua japonica]|uniref:Uncharacterized protein n=1 Tax=Candidatus Scalindua japonica TaxID=1284222 RepID=A0A286TV77_9BACT|nr:hypothetical protein [Candidatus Scalindua japonica]GAX59788.1 hypothetical protein SCALIN_C04_0276 [Candidatus Scalindua japonica]